MGGVEGGGGGGGGGRGGRGGERGGGGDGWGGRWGRMGWGGVLMGEGERNEWWGVGGEGGERLGVAKAGVCENTKGALTVIIALLKSRK